MKRGIGLCCLVLGAMALMLGLALMGFEYVALDAQRYNGYQETLNLYDSVGVTRDELQRVQQNMVAYLQGKGELNEQVALFNEREIAHMRDVRGLFELERAVKRWALALGAALLVVALFTAKRGRASSLAGLMALGIWLASGLAFAAWCGFDFSLAFTRFHELLFTNDLWLLDPRTDAMIRMYPEQFFAWMARDIAVAMGLCALIPALLPLALLRGRRGAEA